MLFNSSCKDRLGIGWWMSECGSTVHQCLGASYHVLSLDKCLDAEGVENLLRRLIINDVIIHYIIECDFIINNVIILGSKLLYKQC